MRAAIAGDWIGSRFERSWWSGRSFGEARCIGYDLPDPRVDATGSEAATFPLIHEDCFITDDSILTIAIMEWLLHGNNLSTVLKSHFRRSHRPELFGQLFCSWAMQDGESPPESVGNGAAMRVSPIGIVAEDEETVLSLARQSAVVTHQVDHAIQGAEAIALGVFLARRHKEKAAIGQAIQSRFGYDFSRPLDLLRGSNPFTSSCLATVPIAMLAFLESAGYEETLRRAISMGGDSDTIACMAGALAGAYWGMPPRLAEEVLRQLNPEQQSVVLEFEHRFPTSLKLCEA